MPFLVSYLYVLIDACYYHMMLALLMPVKASCFWGVGFWIMVGTTHTGSYVDRTDSVGVSNSTSLQKKNHHTNSHRKFFRGVEFIDDMELLRNLWDPGDCCYIKVSVRILHGTRLYRTKYMQIPHEWWLVASPLIHKVLTKNIRLHKTFGQMSLLWATHIIKDKE